jgi:3-methyladenine DNA glycosylase AlkD
LAIDQRVLLNAFLKQCKKETYITTIVENIEKLKKQTVNTVNEAIGISFLQLSIKNRDLDILKKLASHTSDAVRC